LPYIAAADFRERTVKPYCANLILGETDGTDAYLDLIISQVVTQVELDLNDDFEPPNPDNDEIIEFDGNDSYTLLTPRRVRALTTVKTRDSYGTLTTQVSTAYRLRSSLNAAGTAMNEGRKLDWLEALSLTTVVWPCGTNSIQLTGKFGWAAVPDDIKRLVALKVYDQIKGNADPMSRITQRQTFDATITFGPPQEITTIEARYRRDSVMAQ